MSNNESAGGPALMIGIGEPKKPEMNDEGAGDEVCIPLDKLSVADDESGEAVKPAIGDIVNPDMKITRIEGDNAYMVAVDGMNDSQEKDESMDDQEASLRKASEQADQQGMM